MVYCRLLEKGGDFIVYAIGRVINDITGIMWLYPKKHYYEIKKQPDKFEVYEHFIDQMLLKYQEILDSGKVPEKMSREI